MRWRRALPCAALVAVALTSCSVGTDYASTPLPERRGATASPAAPAPPDPDCEGLSYERVVASYSPKGTSPGELARTGYLATIRKRGRLVAGVSADTWLWGARDPFTGAIEGFDIDVLRAVAKALLGSEDRIEFRVLTTAQRIPALRDGDVDVVARTMTINCVRWKEIAFSGEYYHAGQKILVRDGSGLDGLGDLDRRRVCAPYGSTSLDNLVKRAPRAVPVPADTHTGCLVLFQQGVVDAITGDDAILAGLAAQDPYARVVGEAFSDEPYGLGVSLEHPELVRFVNVVLDRLRSGGGWKDIHERWLGDVLGPAPAPPRAVYGRPVPPRAG